MIVKVDMAEMRTLVNDLVEKQRNSASASPPPEVKHVNEVEELRWWLAMLETRSSTIDRARLSLAHETKGGALVPAPRKTAAVKTHSGPKKASIPARDPAATASTTAAAGAPTPAPATKPPVPFQPAKVGLGRNRNKNKGGVVEHRQP